LDVDPEVFGRFSESAARFLGTGKFIFWQTMVVIVWITFNLVAANRAWDPYPFILLNLLFSTQAAYAAPLILLAQNRQDDRDRISLEDDRARAAQTKADTEFLARELAALRVAIGEVATRDYLRGEIDRLRNDLEGLSSPNGKKSKASDSKVGASAKSKPGKSGSLEEPDWSGSTRQPDQPRKVPKSPEGPKPGSAQDLSSPTQAADSASNVEN
jgi:uncharacterized membrane protein